MYIAVANGFSYFERISPKGQLVLLCYLRQLCYLLVDFVCSSRIAAFNLSIGAQIASALLNMYSRTTAFRATVQRLMEP